MDSATCAVCSAPLDPAALACHSCQSFVHVQALHALASQASRAPTPVKKLEFWRQALALVPSDCKQHRLIRQRIARQVKKVDSVESESDASGAWKSPAGLGALGLMLWKGKFIVAMVLTKGKLLLVGLTKGKTVLTMAMSLSLYWAMWGWKFALGFVLSLYVHEMGHVAALRRYGYATSGPMFIPGLGAVVRLQQPLTTPGEDARIGLAGPVWGIGAALFCLAVGTVQDWPVWIALAQVGGWINLFNLIPVWQLDGSRALGALSRAQRIQLMVVVAGTWWWTGVGMLAIIGVVMAFRTFSGASPKENDNGVLALFSALIVIGGALSMIPMPTM